MKTLTKILFLVLSSTLIVGCMPASLTKWDKNTVKTKTVKSTFQDSSGNDIPAANIDVPTIFTYHTSVNPTTYILSSEATTDQVIYPTMDGDLSSYPWTTDGQAMNATFALVSSGNCITITNPGSYPSIASYLSTTSGRFTFPAATLRANGVVAAGEYCVSLTYKAPTSTSPYYAMTTKYAVLKFGVSAPISAFYYQQSKTLILTLTDYVNWNQFTAGNTVRTTNDSGTATGTGVITSFDANSNLLYITRSAGLFRPGQGIKVGTGGVGGTLNDAIISDTVNVFQTATSTESFGVELTYPIFAGSTPISLTYSMSPASPSQYIVFNSTTGSLTGTSATADSAPREIVFMASNESQSASITYKMMFNTKPRGLSYTHHVLLTVDSTSYFVKGNPISCQVGICQGKVREVIDATHLFVDVSNGQFTSNSNVDKYDTYHSSKAWVTAVTPVSAGFELADATALTSQAVGDYIVTTSGGLATIAYISGNVVYTRVISGSFSPTTSVCGVSITTMTPTCTVGETSIKRINAQSYSFKLAAGAVTAGAYKLGRNIISSSGAPLYNSHMVTKVDTVNDILNVSSQSMAWMEDDSYDGSTPQIFPYSSRFAGPLAPATLSTLSYDNIFYVNQGENVTIAPSIIEGGDLKFTISATLPPGLTMDSYGVISGQVSNSQSETSYVVTASNFLGSTSYSFRMKAFQIIEVTATNDAAPTQVIHREGQANFITPCRITKEQIEAQGVGTSTQDNDIICRLDSGELDLFKNGIKLNIYAGKGICNKVSFSPYYFFRFPVSAAGTTGSTLRDVSCSCSTAGACTGDALPGKYLTNAGSTPPYPAVGVTILSADQACLYNYKAWDSDPATSLAPNCDRGSYTLITDSYADNDTGHCTLTAGTPTTVYCGGKVSACLGGGYEDMASDLDYDNGKTTLIYNTYDLEGPFTLSKEFQGPMDSSYRSNLKLANYTNKNTCSDDTDLYKYWKDNWKAFTSSGDYTTLTNPWSGANPYYDVKCLTGAQTFMGRIRIQVRDWDYDFNPLSELDLATPSSLMDDALSNDYRDWDNSWSGNVVRAGAANETNAPDFNAGSCAAGLPTPNTGNYGFPGLNY